MTDDADDATEDQPVIDDEEVSAIADLESEKPAHIKIQQATDEKCAVPKEMEDRYTDPEFFDSDIAIETSRDLRDKATHTILKPREIRFILKYYEGETSIQKGIRNLAFDFEDGLPENQIAIAKAGLKPPRCYIWLAEEVRNQIKDTGLELIITDAEITNAVIKQVWRGNLEEARFILNRFSEVKTRQNRRMIKRKTIETLEKLIEIIAKEENTTPQSN